MSQYVQGKDGKFAGSIGDGKADVPTVSDIPAVPRADASEDSSVSVDQVYEAFAAVEPGNDVPLDVAPDGWSVAPLRESGYLDEGMFVHLRERIVERGVPLPDDFEPSEDSKMIQSEGDPIIVYVVGDKNSDLVVTLAVDWVGPGDNYEAGWQNDTTINRVVNGELEMMTGEFLDDLRDD